MEQGPQPEKGSGSDVIRPDMLAMARECADKHGLRVVPVDKMCGVAHRWQHAWPISRVALNDFFGDGEEAQRYEWQLGATLGRRSGVVVLEVIDDLSDSFNALIDLPRTPISKANGSRYFWFLAPDRPIHSVCAEDLLMPADLLGEDSVAPLPPSLIMGGGREDRAVWVKGCSLNDLELAPLPARILENFVERPERWERKLVPGISAEANIKLLEMPLCVQSVVQHGIKNAAGTEFGAEKAKTIKKHFEMFVGSLVDAGIAIDEVETILERAISNEYRGYKLENILTEGPAKRARWTCGGLDRHVRNGFEAGIADGKCSEECPFFEPDLSRIEHARHYNRGTLFNFTKEKIDSKTGIVHITNKEYLIARCYLKIGLIDPFGEQIQEFWEDSLEPHLESNETRALLKVYGQLPITYRRRGSDVLLDFYHTLPLTPRPLFPNCLVIGADGCSFPGPISDRGRKICADEEAFEELRQIWMNLPAGARTIWALTAANMCRFWLFEAGKIDIMPHILLSGPKSTGKSSHAEACLRAWAGVKGANDHVGGTGVRLYGLVDTLESPTSPVFIDDPTNIKPDISAVFKVIGTSAYEDFPRRTIDLRTIHHYVCSFFIFASNGLKVYDTATIDRLYILRVYDKWDARHPNEIYGDPEEDRESGGMLKVVAHCINTRWDEVAAFFDGMDYLDVRYGDFLRLVRFGVHLIDLAMGVPHVDGDLDSLRTIPPIPPEELLEEVATAEGKVMAGAISRLLSIPVVTTSDYQRQLPLGVALIEGTIAQAEKSRLAAVGIIPSKRKGVLGLRVDTRWVREVDISNLGALQTYLKEQGTETEIATYRGRKRLFIPVPKITEEDEMSAESTSQLFGLTGFEVAIMACFGALDDERSENEILEITELDLLTLKHELMNLAMRGVIATTKDGLWRCMIDPNDCKPT